MATLHVIAAPPGQPAQSTRTITATHPAETILDTFLLEWWSARWRYANLKGRRASVARELFSREALACAGADAHEDEAGLGQRGMGAGTGVAAET